MIEVMDLRHAVPLSHPRFALHIACLIATL
jgi:hypothetical protein